MTTPASDTLREAVRLMQAGRFEDALGPARQAVAESPVCSTAHGLLARLLVGLGQRQEAEIVVMSALSEPAGKADAYDALAFVSMQLGSHQRASLLYARAAALQPHDPRFWYNLASSERSLGRLLEAEAACDRAIEADRHHYQSYLLRSELRTQNESRNHIDEMQRLLTDRIAADRAVIFLGYALGKEFDDLGRYAEAFTRFTRAASARRKKLVYDVAEDERKLRRIAEVYPAPKESDASLVEVSKSCVFIVGLPRSGTTLIERTLTRLPHVRTNGETDNFVRALGMSAAQGPDDIFARFALADPRLVAERYLKSADALGSDKVVEKMPLNYLYLGAIQAALPASIPLLVTRSPLDSCFAMYRTLFAHAYPFTYDFDDLARYYAAYEALTNHWHRLFGDWLVDVGYEEFVKQPTRTGKNIANAIGAEWRDDAIQIEKNQAPSTTASAAQIRRPIYHTSIGRWRHYRSQLAPLVSALRRAGVTVNEAD
jgi:tetratricopeptide (TPR) repeat protein